MRPRGHRIPQAKNASGDFLAERRNLPLHKGDFEKGFGKRNEFIFSAGHPIQKQ
ncbi:hypothetical protein N8813_03200 [bacterium]|jgi:hypothetical protein|nr:hypothetical protein [bacterium]MDC0322071.1 hypothetical protein [Verrucomicrobiales bacterium]